MDANYQKTNLNVTTDKLLRERSFGTGEGKSVQHLQSEARKRNLSLRSYIPPGGEENEQVYIYIYRLETRIIHLFFSFDDLFNMFKLTYSFKYAGEHFSSIYAKL